MACTCGLPLALSRSHDASLITRPSLSSSPPIRARHAKLDVRIAGSKLLRDESSIRRLRAGPLQNSAGMLNLARRGTLTKCSAARGEEESSAQSALQTRVPNESVPQVMEVVSKRLRPYLQLARLNDDWLDGPWSFYMWPFVWGAAFAAENGTIPDWRTLTLLSVGAAVLYSACCTINDLFDMEFDGKVERSKQRPLVTGEVTPLQGWAFLGAQTVLYVAILSHLDALSLTSQFQVQLALQLVLNVFYPLSKRWTYWTPAVLGVATNWGVFLGWSAVRGTTNFEPLPVLLFVGACFWTLVYETIYAHQDIKDDANAGVKSLAILLGDDTKLWLRGFGALLVASLSYAGHMAGLGWPFYGGLVAMAAHVVWQITTVDLKVPTECKSKFRSNFWLGAFVFGGIACGKLLA